MARTKEEEIAMLETRLKQLKAKGEIRQKVGFKEGLKRSFKIFGDSAGTVLKSLGDAGRVVGGSEKQDEVAQQKSKNDFSSIDDVMRRLPA